MNWVFNVFQMLVVDYRSGALTLEILSDEIAEATSDTEMRIMAAKTIRRFANEIEEYNFLAIRSMPENERDEFSTFLHELVEIYLEDRIYENETVNERTTPDHIEDLENRRRLLIEKFNNESGSSDESFSEYRRPKPEHLLFCETCAAAFKSYFSLDEHLAALHSDTYFDRYYCEVCAGMWLTRHFH